MMDFIMNNVVLLASIGLFLIFGVLGYIFDRKRYEKYRQEILNEEYAMNTFQAVPDINNIADVVPVDQGYNNQYAGQDPNNGMGNYPNQMM